MRQNSRVKDLTHGLIKEPRLKLTPELAHQGTSVAIANRSPLLKMWLLSRVIKMSESVDATRRLHTEEEYIDCVDNILDTVPTLKIEEVECVFRQIERGQVELYGRLRTADVLKALLQYDGTTATEMRERQNAPRSDQFERASQSRPDFVSLTVEDLMAIGEIKKKDDHKEESGS